MSAGRAKAHDTYFGDFNGQDVAVARVQQNNPANRLIEKLSLQ
jgi:hypothetical protein